MPGAAALIDDNGVILVVDLVDLTGLHGEHRPPGLLRVEFAQNGVHVELPCLFIGKDGNPLVVQHQQGALGQVGDLSGQAEFPAQLPGVLGVPVHLLQRRQDRGGGGFEGDGVQSQGLGVSDGAYIADHQLYPPVLQRLDALRQLVLLEGDKGHRVLVNRSSKTGQ